MFNQDFYPTPIHIIDLMIEGLELANKNILEPHAGSGNICDYVAKKGGIVYGCEINDKLRSISEKKCQIISNDFLQLTESDVSHIDLIIANPPFSNQEKHILHMWNIAPKGCRIVTLCNSNMINNRYSQQREQINQLINTYGTYENLGECFTDAERTTNVSVSVIRLNKLSDKYQSEFEGFFMDEDIEAQSNGLMSYNFVRDIVNRYVETIKLFDRQLDTATQMHQLTNTFFNPKIGFSVSLGESQTTRQHFKTELQKSAWDYIFNQMNFDKYNTKGLKSDINKFVHQNQELPFTMKNIYKMLEIVIGTTAQRMDKALIEVFDNITYYYHDNRYNVEGWKTNEQYLFGKKFIMPSLVCTSSWYGKHMNIEYGNRQAEYISDLLKVICYFCGKNYDNYTPLIQYLSNSKMAHGTQFEWAFFKCRGYKKGTMHFEFLDEQIWYILNQNVARIKGFGLPEKIKPKKCK